MENSKQLYASNKNHKDRVTANMRKELAAIKLRYSTQLRNINAYRVKHRAFILKHHKLICAGPYPALSANQQMQLVEHYGKTIQRFRKNFDDVFHLADPFFDDIDKMFGDLVGATTRRVLLKENRPLSQMLRRGQFWVFMMGRHPRVGSDSPVRMLPDDVISIIQKHMMPPPLA